MPEKAFSVCIKDSVFIDPCCGSGGMFVQSHKFVESHHGNRKNISVIGQESVQETWRLCKMNLATMSGKNAVMSWTAELRNSKNCWMIKEEHQ